MRHVLELYRNVAREGENFLQLLANRHHAKIKRWGAVDFCDHGIRVYGYLEALWLQIVGDKEFDTL